MQRCDTYEAEMEDLRQSLDEFFSTQVIPVLAIRTLILLFLHCEIRFLLTYIVGLQEDWIHRDQLKDLYNALTIEGQKKTAQRAFNRDGGYSAVAGDPYNGYGDEQTWREAEMYGGRGWQVHHRFGHLLLLKKMIPTILFSGFVFTVLICLCGPERSGGV
jgi:hypothetical protein